MVAAAAPCTPQQLQRLLFAVGIKAKPGTSVENRGPISHGQVMPTLIAIAEGVTISTGCHNVSFHPFNKLNLRLKQEKA